MSGSESNNSRQSATNALLLDLYSYCRSDSFSEDGLREIIERHGGLTPNLCLCFMAPNPNNPTDGSGFFFEGIIRYLLEYFPDAASASNKYGQTSLHIALYNKHVTLSTVRLLVDAAPNSIRHADNKGMMPLHYFCRNKDVDEIIALEILKLLIERHPEALRHDDNDSCLPVHYACGYGSKSPEFCRALIEASAAYPGSERLTDGISALPLHWACAMNTVATVEYLCKLYPDAINRAIYGRYPIHIAIESTIHGDNPIAAVDIVQYLLDCDPNVKSQKCGGRSSPLHWACQQEYNDSNIEAGIQVIKVIYDAHPEAIENNEIISDIHGHHPRVHAFLKRQLVCSHQAKDYLLMTTPDKKGQLLLHRMLQINVRLGSIILLAKGNHLAVQTPDNSGALPLHVACAHHESASVVQYLLDLDATTLDSVDKEGNSALHYACRGAKYKTIALLLDEYDAVSVSKRNAHKKLPIDLLWESNKVLDRERVEYTESIFRLLKAYPETLINTST